LCSVVPLDYSETFDHCSVSYTSVQLRYTLRKEFPLLPMARLNKPGSRRRIFLHWTAAQPAVLRQHIMQYCVASRLVIKTCSPYTTIRLSPGCHAMFVRNMHAVSHGAFVPSLQVIWLATTLRHFEQAVPFFASRHRRQDTENKILMKTRTDATVTNTLH
jgi:hypothetical protein